MLKPAFQFNLVSQVNGFTIKAMSSPLSKEVIVQVNRDLDQALLDLQRFNFEEPADQAAMFAKLSVATTWCATYQEQPVQQAKG